MNICRTHTWLTNSPVPDVEYYVTKQDLSLDKIELTLTKPSATAPRDLLIWSAKVNAGKREYLAQFELRNQKDERRIANIKLLSPIRTITAEMSIQNIPDINMTKMEVDLNFPNVIYVNTKYKIEKNAEESNVEVLMEYQLPGSDRREVLKWNQKSDYSKEKKSSTNKHLFYE